MTEATRDAVREIINRDEWEDDDLDALSGAIIEALEPHFAAREAAAVASAVLAEREACAVVLDAEIARTKHRRDIFERMDIDESVRGLNGDIGLLSALAAAIRARSTQESGR